MIIYIFGRFRVSYVSSIIMKESTCIYVYIEEEGDMRILLPFGSRPDKDMLIRFCVFTSISLFIVCR